MVTVDTFSCQALEFPEVIDLLKEFLSGPISQPRLASVTPSTRLEEIRQELDLTAEAIAYLRSEPRPAVSSLKDPQPILEKVRIAGAILPALETAELVRLAGAASEFRKLFATSLFPRLSALSRSVADFRGLLAELGGKILPDGSLDSSASPALARIRKDIARMQLELQQSLEKMLRRFEREKVLQDTVVTVRNGRFVVPIRAEEKRKVAGVVHGASSSGATVYVEPLDTVSLNNDLVELQEREYAEIQRVLSVFSQKLRERWQELKDAAEILSELDLAFAKAEFARVYNCAIPQFCDEHWLSLKNTQHPLLVKTLRAQGRRPVPVTFELKDPKMLMVISGPNAGGKTLTLKTIGIAVLMAQAGLPVLAEEIKLPLFDRVLVDIGDQQSIQASLSTFSAHVTNLQAMIGVAARNDLVLLDEIGVSTEPNEGAALALAVLEHFRAVGVMTLVTTHYSRIKAYATETPEALNAAMEFDEATLAPTYRLLIGVPGKSSALEVAERLGLDPSIVRKAHALLNPADAQASNLIAKLHELKKEWDGQVVRLDEERKRLEDRELELNRSFERERRLRLHELETRLEETLRNVEKKLENALGALSDRESRIRETKKIMRQSTAIRSQAREDWSTQVEEALGGPTVVEDLTKVELLPAVGDRVRVTALSTPGTVTSLADDGRIEVEVGRLRMRLRRDEVHVLKQGKGVPEQPQSGLNSSVAWQEEAPGEINVIGSSAEEARELVDKYLDQAFLAGRARVRIIHGHGKGILRKTVHDMLAAHVHVEKFYFAAPAEGGTGATVVELRL